MPPRLYREGSCTSGRDLSRHTGARGSNETLETKEGKLNKTTVNQGKNVREKTTQRWGGDKSAKPCCTETGTQTSDTVLTWGTKRDVHEARK